MSMDLMSPDDVRAIIVHCTATRPGKGVVEQVRQIHVQENGWDAIGYHYIIDRTGVVHAARPMMFQGAHARGANAYSLGVALEGGVDANNQPQRNYTTVQYASLYALIGILKELYPTIKEVFGHNDMERMADFKACPVFNVREWYGAYALALSASKKD